jgi:hypothetical protein
MFFRFASRSPSLLFAPVLVSGALQAGCSAGDAPDAANAPPLLQGPGPSEPAAELITEVDQTEGGGSGPLPFNVGSEQVCDGLDDNNNGIIDDVDVGNDGLCDCIRLGFFGQINSDAGAETAAFQAWLVERSGQVPLKSLPATGTLTAAWLSDIQVLIVGGMQARAAQAGGGASFTADEIATFEGWLSTGGGVFTLAGYSATAADVAPTNELLANTGVRYETASVAPEGVIGEGAPPTWLTGIVTPDHPSVEGVAEIGVYFGYPVVGDGTVILREQTYDLAMAKTFGDGRLFAFADEWITQDLTWSGAIEGQSDPCQQPCNEEQNICRISSEQCERCASEPCSDPNDTDVTTCSKGCQPSCESETQRCQDFAQQCAECSGGFTAREQATPRLWLNTIRWLTPENECQVEIPPKLRVR